MARRREILVTATAVALGVASAGCLSRGESPSDDQSSNGSTTDPDSAADDLSVHDLTVYNRADHSRTVEVTVRDLEASEARFARSIDIAAHGEGTVPDVLIGRREQRIEVSVDQYSEQFDCSDPQNAFYVILPDPVDNIHFAEKLG